MQVLLHTSFYVQETFSSSSFLFPDFIPLGESGPLFFSTPSKCAGYIPQFVPHSLLPPSPIEPKLGSATHLPKTNASRPDVHVPSSHFTRLTNKPGILLPNACASPLLPRASTAIPKSRICSPKPGKKNTLAFTKDAKHRMEQRQQSKGQAKEGKIFLVSYMWKGMHLLCLYSSLINSSIFL